MFARKTRIITLFFAVKLALLAYGLFCIHVLLCLRTEVTLSLSLSNTLIVFLLQFFTKVPGTPALRGSVRGAAAPGHAVLGARSLLEVEKCAVHNVNL